ncbi:MAG: TIGR03643 family protein [Planctomycetaceae bacterium]
MPHHEDHNDQLYHTPLTDTDIDRIIQMAWEDRTSFEAIHRQFGLTPGDVIKLMRAQLTARSFKLWRERTAGRKTKHEALRSFRIGRFRAPGQKD